MQSKLEAQIVDKSVFLQRDSLLSNNITKISKPNLSKVFLS